MATEYRRGQRVRSLATYYDQPGSNNAWSREQFGDEFETAYCYGCITRILKNGKVKIKWEMDNSISTVSISLIERADHVDLVERADSPSSVSSLSSSESSSSESSNERNEEQNIQRIDDENEIVINDVKWRCALDTRIDKYKDGEYKPKLLNIPNRQLTELDVWMLFFPSDKLSYILRCTNSRFDCRNPITEQELFKFFGLMYAMTLHVLPDRRSYWGTVSDGIYPAPEFGKRFNMSRKRFEDILKALSFTDGMNAEIDDWIEARSLVSMVNERWYNVICPGYKMTVDESMFAWYGRDSYRNGMPAVIKIKRKPKAVGCETKTIADSLTNIMIGLEINEGKNCMANKKWQREFGAGTATTLRLTERWHGTGRIVVGDSWFSSVKTAVQLSKSGLYYIGMVKTAYKKFPLQKLRDICPTEKGAYVHAVAEDDNVQVYATAWRDRKIHTFVSSCGTTLPGQASRKRRYREDGTWYFKEITRPHVVQTYFDGAPAIDIHNHIRQGGLALEEVWRTQNWVHRMFGSILGIIETNAFLAFNYFISTAKIDHNQFTTNLSMQLINNNRGLEVNEVQNENSNIMNIVINNNHLLEALSKTDERQRVQRKCIVCSRVRKVQQKASYYCKPCGLRCVLCSPQTGRNCFAYHIQNGIPT